MHIAIDARIINSSTGTYVERLLHYLQQIDTTNRYTVLLRKKDSTYWVPSNPNFSVAIAEFDNYSFAEQIGFKRYLDKLHPDLVHFCMPQQPVLYSGRAVTTIHDLTLLNTYNSDKNWFIFHVKQFVGRFVFKEVAHKSVAVFTPTHYTKDALLQLSNVPPEKIVVTYEAAELPTVGFSTEPYPAPYDQFLLYVGQQSDYKNIKRLGDAHHLLRKTNPDLGLILVGKKGSDAAHNERYFESQGYKNIHFTGFIPNEQRDWLMQHCAAYVFPSLMEGFGLPGLEAMAMGAPVISSNATCLPEVYGDAAEYFDPTSSKAMAEAIDRVIRDDSVRQDLIRAGSAKVRTYSWQRMAEETHAAYMAALGTFKNNI